MVEILVAASLEGSSLGEEHVEYSTTHYTIEDVLRFRYQIFKKRLHWDVPYVDDLERDSFDGPSTTHILAIEKGEIKGCLRLLPCSKPYLLEHAFPVLFYDQPCPKTSTVWEVSRLTYDGRSSRYKFHTGSLGLMLAAVRFALKCGVRYFVMAIGLGLEKMLRRLGLVCSRYGAPIVINNEPTIAVKIVVSEQTETCIVEALRQASGAINEKWVKLKTT